MAGHHVLLVLAWAGLGQAALRLVSRTAPAGLERVLAAAVVAVAAAVAQALALGLAGLGSEPLALAGAAGGTWLAARRALPAPAVGPGAELSEAWGGLGPAARGALGAVAGGALALVVAFERRPPLGLDGVLYHLTEVAAWIESGRPGAVVDVLHEFPVGNYPLTNEVALAWSMGISRSFVPVAVWQVAILLLLALAGWVGLRAVRVPPLPRALAVLALVCTPVAVEQLHGPNTDLPATAWLVAAAALCAAARGRAGLLGIALVAAGLAVGTKTTAAPLAAGVVAWALLARAGAAPARRRALALGALAAVAVGGVWYLRNAVLHGSPLWPFVPAPWGDPAPPVLDRLSPSALDRPRATFEGRLGAYGQALGGGAVLLLAALAAPLVVRTRAALAGAALTFAGLLGWLNAPVTGIASDPRIAFYSITTVRYLLPVLAVAALTLALTARSGRRGAWWGTGALAVAGLVSVSRWPQISPQVLPAPGWLVPAGALAGALAGAALAGAAARAVPWPRAAVPRLAATALVLALGGLALSLPAAGFVERHARVGFLDAGLVRWFAQRTDAQRVAMGPVVVGALAGDDLDRSVSLIPAGEPCAAVRERLRGGQWVVLKDPEFEEALTGVPYEVGRCLGDRPPAYADADGFRVYAPSPARATSGSGSERRR